MITRRKVRFQYLYRGSRKRGRKVVHPYGFLYGNRHYLVDWSVQAQASCNFALSNIERVEVLDSSFTPKPAFSLRTYAQRSFGVFQESRST
jgi:predicted DNA-binding transcriptional regulator YafY